jgi:hypothetical protein
VRDDGQVFGVRDVPDGATRLQAVETLDAHLTFLRSIVGRHVVDARVVALAVTRQTRPSKNSMRVTMMSVTTFSPHRSRPGRPRSRRSSPRSREAQARAGRVSPALSLIVSTGLGVPSSQRTMSS